MPSGRTHTDVSRSDFVYKLPRVRARRKRSLRTINYVYELSIVSVAVVVITSRNPLLHSVPRERKATRGVHVSIKKKK